MSFRKSLVRILLFGLLLGMTACDEQGLGYWIGEIDASKGNRDPIIEAAIIQQTQLAFNESTKIIVLANDPDGDSLYYHYETHGVGSIEGSGADATYISPSSIPGKEMEHTITVYVSDLTSTGSFKGGIDSAEMKVIIKNHPPHISTFSPGTPGVELNDTITLSLSASDEDEDDLTYTIEASCPGIFTPDAIGDLDSGTMQFTFSEFNTWGKLAFKVTVSDPVLSTTSTTLVQVYPPQVSRLEIQNFNEPYEGWAIGENGMILHYNGTYWKQEDTFSDKPFNAFYAIPNSLASWAVGDNATMRYFDGSTFRPYFSSALDSSLDHLYDASFYSSDEGIFVGANSSILHYNNNELAAGTIVSSPAMDSEITITSVDMVSTDAAYACGDEDLVLRKLNDTNWYDERLRFETPPTGKNYEKIYMVSSSDGYVLGSNNSTYFLDYYSKNFWPPENRASWGLESDTKPFYYIDDFYWVIAIPHTEVESQQVCLLELSSGMLDCNNEYNRYGMIHSLYLEDKETGFIAVESAVNNWSAIYKITAGALSPMKYNLITQNITSIKVSQIIQVSETETWAVALLGLSGGTQRTTFLRNDSADSDNAHLFIEWEEDGYIAFLEALDTPQTESSEEEAE